MRKEISQTEEELDLGLLVCAMLKKSWAILFASILGASIALVGTFYLVKPQYQSTVTLYADNPQRVENLEDSFSVILHMRETLLDVIKYTQTDRSHHELSEMVNVTSVNHTDFFELTVTCPDPYEAERLANSIGEVLPSRIAEIMGGITVTVVDEAVLAAAPSSPNYPNNGLLGFVIGMTLSMAIVFLQELFPSQQRPHIKGRYS